MTNNRFFLKLRKRCRFWNVNGRIWNRQSRVSNRVRIFARKIRKAYDNFNHMIEQYVPWQPIDKQGRPIRNTNVRQIHGYNLAPGKDKTHSQNPSKHFF